MTLVGKILLFTHRQPQSMWGPPSIAVHGEGAVILRRGQRLVPFSQKIGKCIDWLALNALHSAHQWLAPRFMSYPRFDGSLHPSGGSVLRNESPTAVQVSHEGCAGGLGPWGSWLVSKVEIANMGLRG